MICNCKVIAFEKVSTLEVNVFVGTKISNTVV